MIMRPRKVGRIDNVLLIEAVWGRIHQPRAVNALMLVAYTIAFLFGISLIAFRPEGVTDIAGILTTILLGIALTTGGATSAASCFVGAWWLERIGNLVVFFGYLALGFVILWMEDLSPFMKVAVVLSISDALAAMLRRYYSIGWAYLDPAK